MKSLTIINYHGSNFIGEWQEEAVKGRVRLLEPRIVQGLQGPDGRALIGIGELVGQPPFMSFRDADVGYYTPVKSKEIINLYIKTTTGIEVVQGHPPYNMQS